ncbi:MAG: hypothetical protein M3R08_05260 [Bacteroidota bacterium]|nr:hypothetical protein [Bacteroidota bacterium]
MKRTYRISGKEQRPSDEEIARYRDHPRLQANYNKALKMMHRRPIYRDPKAFLALLLIALLVWMIIEAARSPEGQPVKQHYELREH